MSNSARQGEDRQRSERLAAALRENLRRRKAQARAADGTSVPAEAGAQSVTQNREPTQPASE